MMMTTASKYRSGESPRARKNCGASTARQEYTNAAAGAQCDERVHVRGVMPERSPGPDIELPAGPEHDTHRQEQQSVGQSLCRGSG